MGWGSEHDAVRVHNDLDLLRCVLDVASMDAMVELVLPDDLKPLLAEYSDPIQMEELMWPIHNRNAPSELTWYGHDAFVSRPQAAA